MPHIPAFLEPFLLTTIVIVLAAVFGGLRLALARSESPFGAHVGIWTVLVGAALVWFGVILYLGRQGVFQAAPDVLVPALPFAIVVPIVVALALLVRSAAMARLIDAIPLSWLVGLQFYRVLGGVFLALWAGALLPGQFALPAGIGDVLVGLFAVLVAWMAAKGAAAARQAAYAWNIFGILDLVVALATGFLTSPVRFQLLALDEPNLLASAYPLVLVPAFAVPLSLILHGLCIWKLRRMARPRQLAPRALRAER